MNSLIIENLKHLKIRFDELKDLLSDIKVIKDINMFKNLSIEYSKIEPMILLYDSYIENSNLIESLLPLLNDKDYEIRYLADLDLKKFLYEKKIIENKLSDLLLYNDPEDEKNVFLEVRAATGGRESSLFVTNLLRMYLKYSENNKWKVEIISENLTEDGGHKEVIIRIIGNNVYYKLKHESGTHRVQRVPETESQGRIHTSTCTVVVLPEVSEVKYVNISNDDIKIDTYRASGAGGQHVNRTDSAVRITHIPSGIVAECQEDRSQHKNKAKAMSLLYSRLLKMEKSKQKEKIDGIKKNLIGSGDRSEKIRTYNYNQNRITDHRLNLTLYNLTEVIDGNLDLIIKPIIKENKSRLFFSG